MDLSLLLYLLGKDRWGSPSGQVLEPSLLALTGHLGPPQTGMVEAVPDWPAPWDTGAATVKGMVRRDNQDAVLVGQAGGWQIVWRDELVVKPGQKVSKKRELPPLQALGFALDELRDARLAPLVDFKGRSRQGAPHAE